MAGQVHTTYMTTAAVTAPTAIVAAQSNDTLLYMYRATPSVLRDNDGNLRSMTDYEADFLAAIRAEVKRRRLL